MEKKGIRGMTDKSEYGQDITVLVMDWIVSAPHPAPNLYVEALTPKYLGMSSYLVIRFSKR